MALPIAPGTYGIDTYHSQLGFSVRHLDISVIRGMFERYSGALCVGDDLSGTVVAIEAEMASINSGHRGRDEQMFGGDWFDVVNYPQMSFRSTSIVEAPGGFAMTGDLTIKGITRAVTLHTIYNGSAIFPMDESMHFGFEASGVISRSAFGVSYAVPLVSDEVRLTLDAQFILAAAEA